MVSHEQKFKLCLKCGSTLLAIAAAVGEADSSEAIPFAFLLSC